MAHFQIQILNSEGVPHGSIINCKTAVGVALQCPNSMDCRDIDHLCAMAFNTPDYPVDLVAWVGPENQRRITWSARMYYRS